jgi:hypothetical protein
MGCLQGLTECPRLTIPDNTRPPAWGCKGYQVAGTGIVIGGYTEDMYVAHNQVTRVAKYAVGVKGETTGTAPIERLVLRDNRIENVGHVGIFLAGTIDSIIEGNLVAGTHTYGCPEGNAWTSWGIQTHGTLRNTVIRKNVLRDLASVGIGSNAVVEHLLIEDNRLENLCLERDRSVGSEQGAIHLAGSGDFLLVDDVVTANRCSMALYVGTGSDAQVTVEGGRYSTGENADERYGALHVESGNLPKLPRVFLKGGVLFTYQGEGDHQAIVASGNGTVVLLDGSLRVEGYDEALSEMDQCVTPSCRPPRRGRIVECAKRPQEPECRQ